MSKKSYHFLTLWPWPLTYDIEKSIRSGHYHYQCVYQIWEQSIPWFMSYRINTIAGGGRRGAGGGRLLRKTITSPDPWDTGDMITIIISIWSVHPHGYQEIWALFSLKLGSLWYMPVAGYIRVLTPFFIILYQYHHHYAGLPIRFEQVMGKNLAKLVCEYWYILFRVQAKCA